MNLLQEKKDIEAYLEASDIKAYLLAAILRNLGIPTGFCYQKLILDVEEKPWLVIHGLNAIYLKSVSKWIRVDARGNKE